MRSVGGNWRKISFFMWVDLGLFSPSGRLEEGADPAGPRESLLTREANYHPDGGQVCRDFTDLSDLSSEMQHSWSVPNQIVVVCRYFFQRVPSRSCCCWRRLETTSS